MKTYGKFSTLDWLFKVATSFEAALDGPPRTADQGVVATAWTRALHQRPSAGVGAGRPQDAEFSAGVSAERLTTTPMSTTGRRCELQMFSRSESHPNGWLRLLCRWRERSGSGMRHPFALVPGQAEPTVADTHRPACLVSKGRRDAAGASGGPHPPWSVEDDGMAECHRAGERISGPWLIERTS